MAELPLAWRTYAAHQSELKNRTVIDSSAWGIEEGLNVLLDGDEGGRDVARTIGTAARRDRYRRALLAKFFSKGAGNHGAIDQLEARSALAALQRKMPSETLDILIDTANSSTLVGVAENHGIAIGALRTRISRGRRLARAIAA